MFGILYGLLVDRNGSRYATNDKMSRGSSCLVINLAQLPRTLASMIQTIALNSYPTSGTLHETRLSDLHRAERSVNPMEGELLSKSQLDALTYPSAQPQEFTLDDNLPTPKLLPIDSPDRKPPEFDLGALDRLPIELLQGLLPQLDLCSLMQFRRVNRRAIEIVESIFQYRAIATHASNVLQGALRTGAGKWISCETVYEKLCAAECEQCGDFGGYLYILTCKRVCFLCLSEDETFLPLLGIPAIRKFGINLQILGTLPCLRIIPGEYSLKKVNYPVHSDWVDRESAYHAGVVLHGSPDAMEQYASNALAQELQEFDQKASEAVAERFRPYNDSRRRLITHEVSDHRSGNPRRFLAIVRIPWVKRMSQELEWGFHCIGCRNLSHSRQMHSRRKFTVTTFMEHLRECGNIRDKEHCPQ
jgi:hypothetical protein